MSRALLALPFLLLALPSAAQTPRTGLDGRLETLPPMEQAAVAEGFGAAREIRRDTTIPFSMELFMEGFQHGMDGDSLRLSYLYGFQIGSQMRQDTVLRYDRDLFLEGFRYGIEYDSLPLSEARQNRLRSVIGDTLTMRDLRNRARTDSSARDQLAIIARNAEESERFLARLSEADSVETTGSGIRYVVVQPGEGAQPHGNDIVMVRISGRLPDGTLISLGAGVEAVPLQVGAFAIEGINEALLAMKPGERRRLYIPPDLALGMAGLPSQGDMSAIPPSSVLIFDVTLEEVMGLPSRLQRDYTDPEDLPPDE